MSDVSKFFQQKLDILLLSQEQKDNMVQKINEVTQEVTDLLKYQKLKFPENQKDLQQYVKKHNHNEALNSEQFAQIQQRKIKEQERLKKELQEKLESINSSIIMMTGFQDDKKIANSVTDERKQRLRETREKFMSKREKDQEELKKKEAEELAKQ